MSHPGRAHCHSRRDGRNSERESSIAVALLFVVGLAHAESPSDFRSQASVTIAPGDALQRLTLPKEAYRDARPDLADIRIFNAKGEVMPMAYAGIADPVIEEAPAVALPMFPIYSAPPGREGASRLDIRVRSGRDGTIVSVQESGRRDTTQRPIAWLLDASQVKAPIGQVIVDWNSGPGTEVARVTIEASSDLKSWTTVASRAPVMRVEYGGRQLSQRRIDIGRMEARYLRITAEPQTFVLRVAEVQPRPEKRPPSRNTIEILGKPGAKAGEYVYDADARLPVEAVRARFDETNTVAAMAILARDSESVEGRRVANATFYRLVRDGVELESPVVEVGRSPARYWVARLDQGSPPPARPPRLELVWRPAQVVFVARGEGPFTLAFGQREAKPVVMQPNQLIPGYQRLDELKLREAQVGAASSAAPRDEWVQKIVGDTPPKKIALWAVLIVAVIALAVMAMKLSGQVNAKKPE